MISKFEQFRRLHQSKTLLVVPNAWNAGSVHHFEENGFTAIGTSSAAVAASLGYEDGERMSFSEYFMIIKRITAATSLPVTVDLEMGYGQTNDAIYANILKLLEAGVIGINIEDSFFQNSDRTLKAPHEFGRTLEYIRNQLLKDGHSLFINARCDTYLLNIKEVKPQTAQRVKLYESCGADGIFLPFICREEDIREAITYTKLPLNVMCIPGLPGFDRLQELGVSRVSMGPFLYQKVSGFMNELLQKVMETHHFNPLL